MLPNFIITTVSYVHRKDINKYLVILRVKTFVKTFWDTICDVAGFRESVVVVDEEFTIRYLVVD